MRTQPHALMLAAGLVAAALTPAGRAQTADTHAPGIYVALAGQAGADTLQRLRGSTPKDVKTKGMMKMVLTQGLSRGSTEADLAGPAADIRVPAGATTFYFYFNSEAGQPDPSKDPMAALSMMSGDAMPPQARSASDFALIRLKTSGDMRAADLGRPGATIKPKNTVAVTVERLAQGAYKLQPKDPLTPGEYAFCFVSGMGAGGLLWDFGVDGR
jgi:hypothetical protein